MDLEMTSPVGETVYDILLAVVGGMVAGVIVVNRDQPTDWMLGFVIPAVALLVLLAVGVRLLSD